MNYTLGINRLLLQHAHTHTRSYYILGYGTLRIIGLMYTRVLQSIIIYYMCILQMYIHIYIQGILCIYYNVLQIGVTIDMQKDGDRQTEQSPKGYLGVINSLQHVYNSCPSHNDLSQLVIAYIARYDVHSSLQHTQLVMMYIARYSVHSSLQRTQLVIAYIARYSVHSSLI